MTPITTQTTSDSGRFGGAGVASRLNRDVVVCDACGCRLTTRDTARDAGAAGAWYHFGGQPGRDARGCSVSCAEAPHAI